MAGEFLINNHVFALLTRLIAERLRQNGVEEEIEIMHGCPKNSGCKAASFITKGKREVLCCLRYVMQHPNTNLRDDIIELHFESAPAAAVENLSQLMQPLEFGLGFPILSGSSSWD